jgi:hypothetical protein
MLDIQGGNLRIMGPGGNDGRLDFKRTSDGWNPVRITQQYNTGAYGGDLAFQLHPADGVAGTAPVTTMYLKAGGNVGIGTASPSGKLDVRGAVQITNTSGYAVPNNFMQAGSLTIGDTLLNYGGGFQWTTNTAGLLMECLDSTEFAVHDAASRTASFMYYTSDNRFTVGRDMGYGPIASTNFLGRVGIGAASPGSALSFGAVINNKILTLYDGNAADPVSTATNFLGFGINSATLRYQVSVISDQHLFYCGATAYYRINSSGGANVSDRQFKSEIENISNALATIQQLQGITFKMQDLEKRQMGFVAQDVAELVPEVVTMDENTDIYYMSYDKLTALLCEGIKELSSENTALKQSLASATARLDSLESRLAAAGI